VAVMMFKLEGQLILRHPEYHMEERLLLDKMDLEAGTVLIREQTYPLKEKDFPTIDPADPYKLTEEEQQVIARLKKSFLRSEKLQRHVRFLYSAGSLYKCVNHNLLIHGCVPMDPDGGFTELELQGKKLSGRALLDYADALIRKGYFAPRGSEERRQGEDFFWYLWCGGSSPLFGRDRMTTFERALIADKTTWEEPENSFYVHTEREEGCRRVLEAFDIPGDSGHIVCGHIPVRCKDGESPIKGNGRLIRIDGGFSAAYQPTTGIAGYTLIYNSYNMRLVSHQPFSSVGHAVQENQDIFSTSLVFERVGSRRLVSDTHVGEQLRGQIEVLYLLLDAYRTGMLPEIKT
jgi:fructose-1,6-bisphosphatase-3